MREEKGDEVAGWRLPVGFIVSSASTASGTYVPPWRHTPNFPGIWVSHVFLRLLHLYDIPPDYVSHQKKPDRPRRLFSLKALDVEGERGCLKYERWVWYSNASVNEEIYCTLLMRRSKASWEEPEGKGEKMPFVWKRWSGVWDISRSGCWVPALVIQSSRYLIARWTGWKLNGTPYHRLFEF